MPFFEIKLKFLSNNNNIQKEFKHYISRVSELLPGYNVAYTRLDEKVEVNSKENFIPIKIILTAKKP